MDGDDIIEHIRQKARTASPGYGRYAALQEARRLLLGSGVITVEDDLEELVSNSGPHQGLRPEPRDEPAAPAMEAGQRDIAYLLARIHGLEVRANARLSEAGASPMPILGELLADLTALRVRYRRRVPTAAWEAARKTIAAERRRPAGWVSGPT